MPPRARPLPSRRRPSSYTAQSTITTAQYARAGGRSRRSDPFRTVAPVGIADAPARAIVKIVLIIVAVILCLYLIYLLRRPITWLFIAMFIAVALSPPVNCLSAT